MQVLTDAVTSRRISSFAIKVRAWMSDYIKHDTLDVVTIVLLLMYGDVKTHRYQKNGKRSEIGVVTWFQVTFEVIQEMSDQKLHKSLGFEDESKWLAKLLDSR